MTELLICILPYSLIILGATTVTYLLIGQQEVLKTIAWASPKPDKQTEDDVTARFFVGTPGTLSFAEDNEYEPEVSDTKQEPVLPYSQKDIAAAISRGSVRVVHKTSLDATGNVSIDVNISTTKGGGELQKLGIIDAGNLESEKDVNPEEIEDMSFDFDIDEDITGEMAETLASWLTYSKSEMTYKYQLGVQGRLPLESEGDDADAFRKEHILGEGQPEFAFESASPNPEGERGYLIEDDVDMEAFKDMDYNSEDGSAVDPIDADLNDLIIKEGEPAEKFWDKDAVP